MSFLRRRHERDEVLPVKTARQRLRTAEVIGRVDAATEQLGTALRNLEPTLRTMDEAKPTTEGDK